MLAITNFLNTQPASIDNPCNGGGVIRAWTNVNGVLDVDTITVPPNVSLDGFVATTIWGGSADGIQFPSDQCDLGGRCLFDALDIFGIELPNPVGLGWCAAQSVFVPPVEGGETPTGTTEEEEDFGDAWDEEAIAENCASVTEEPDEPNCDINTYCNTHDGRQILLSFEDGPNVVICRFVTRSGNCTSLRGRCNCQPEVTDGQEIVRIDDPTGELCDLTEYMTCAEYHAEYNCQGPEGQGTGGTFTEDTPPIDKWFLSSPNKQVPINKVLYPNPFTNEINIKISSETEKELITQFLH